MDMAFHFVNDMDYVPRRLRTLQSGLDLKYDTSSNTKTPNHRDIEGPLSCSRKRGSFTECTHLILVSRSKPWRVRFCRTIKKRKVLLQCSQCVDSIISGFHRTGSFNDSCTIIHAWIFFRLTRGQAVFHDSKSSRWSMIVCHD